MKTITTFFRLVIIFVLLTTISSCQSNKLKIEEPSKEFYINDGANALLQSTKWYIYANGEIYYELNNDNAIEKSIRGPQIVVVTHIGEVGSINTTDIFNNYGVGKNDLGIMIFLFFQDIGGVKVFDELVIEIGIKMRNYLSANEASTLIDHYFYDPSLNNDYDAMIINLYYQLIEVTSKKLYNWEESYIYDTFYNFDDYLDEQYILVKPLPSEEYSFFSNFKTWHIIVIVIIVLLFGNRYFGFLFFIPFGGGKKGGGGKSGGYWFRK